VAVAEHLEYWLDHRGDERRIEARVRGLMAMMYTSAEREEIGSLPSRLSKFVACSWPSCTGQRYEHVQGKTRDGSRRRFVLFGVLLSVFLSLLVGFCLLCVCSLAIGSATAARRITDISPSLCGALGACRADGTMYSAQTSYVTKRRADKLPRS